MLVYELYFYTRMDFLYMDNERERLEIVYVA